MRVEGLSFNKGRCFVEFSSREEAVNAVSEVNEKLEIKGKLLMAQCGISTAAQARVMPKITKRKLSEEKIEFIDTTTKK